MQRPKTLEETAKRGQELSGHDEPLAAWNGQQSTRSERFHVIFDGKVYFNTEWVDAVQVPGDTSNAETNPWKYEREATREEITRLGNPTGYAHLPWHQHPLKS
jgi:hypothetical protein